MVSKLPSAVVHGGRVRQSQWCGGTDDFVRDGSDADRLNHLLVDDLDSAVGGDIQSPGRRSVLHIMY
jgi:hypothetical protein